MKISVNTENGFMPAKYSKYAEEKFKYKENPIVSFPIEIEDAPINTKSFALSLIDYDAVPVCGFPWIHWVACDVPGTVNNIPENISRDKIFNIIQGKNSFCTSFIEGTDIKLTEGYVGPTPPDKDHNYTLEVYALDCDTLFLENGFYLNELYNKMKNHMLDKTSITICARF